jgi:hypothetical protein
MYPLSDYNAKDVILLMYSYAEQLNKPCVSVAVCEYKDTCFMKVAMDQCNEDCLKQIKKKQTER